MVTLMFIPAFNGERRKFFRALFILLSIDLILFLNLLI